MFTIYLYSSSISSETIRSTYYFGYYIKKKKFQQCFQNFGRKIARVTYFSILVHDTEGSDIYFFKFIVYVQSQQKLVI